MKRIIAILILVLVVTGCNPASSNETGNSEEVIEVTVLSVSQEGLLVYQQDIGLISLEKSDDFKRGDVLDIVYDGGIRESYPAQLGKVLKISKKKTNENEIILYMKMVEKLLEQTNLAKDIEEAAVNIKGLKRADLSALNYLLHGLLKVEKIHEVESLEQLKSLVPSIEKSPEKGYENGIYLIIEASEDSFIKAAFWKSQEKIFLMEFSYEKEAGIYQLKVRDDN